jgi:hypothetical protein
MLPSQASKRESCIAPFMRFLFVLCELSGKIGGYGIVALISAIILTWDTWEEFPTESEIGRIKSGFFLESLCF